LKMLKSLLLCTCIATSGLAIGDLSEGKLRFQVLLDEKPIGSHSFQFIDSDSQRVIESTAAFDVSVLFVPVFSYRHNNTEVWRNGCLVHMESETDSNGTQYRVAARQENSAMAVVTESSAHTYAADCLMSFAYWDRRILDQQRLLNSQTGELVEVDILPLGATEITLGDLTLAADGYHIQAEDADVDIRVWYGQTDGRWLALESRLPNGRLMRYVPTETSHLSAVARNGLQTDTEEM